MRIGFALGLRSLFKLLAKYRSSRPDRTGQRQGKMTVSSFGYVLLGFEPPDGFESNPNIAEFKLHLEILQRGKGEGGNTSRVLISR